MRDTKRLPKAHLHLHLEGSARSSTIRELAEREGVALPTLTKRRFEDFADFGEALSAFTQVRARSILRSSQARSSENVALQ